MKRQASLKHTFVEFIPDKLESGTLYVSMAFATVAHKCCCGCGSEVVTPLSPTDWKLIFDGKSVSLEPSIGNWSFPCQSHYWITGGKIRWSRQWSEDEVASGRAAARLAKERHFERSAALSDGDRKDKPKRKLWRRLWKW
jgi:hypothetical protein